MPFHSGARLGNYEILGPLGKGGMGEVYRAKDTKLGREVAVKVLPAAFANHPERLARFEREAKVLASLNHPNIATIYAVEESDEGKALIMELVPGETLKGPVPLDTALKYAAQIASALDAAHEKGITHRDLKPANVMLTPDGVIKVLDFGLAAVTQPSQESVPDGATLPTLSMSPTQSGMVLGTAPYMSPEQASGEAVDRRTDIWAFGVVLWELLAGKRLFQGETVAKTLAAVLAIEPDLSVVPAKVRRLLAACLQKDPKQRMPWIGAWTLLLEENVTPASAGGAHRLKPVLLFIVPLLAAALAWVSWLHFRPTAPPVVTRFSIPLGEGQNPVNRRALAMSPDGTQMVYAANRRLYLRRSHELEARAIPGTDLGGNVFNPVFSPDGKSIAFVQGDAIKKVEASGGVAVTLGPILSTNLNAGASWGPEGIVFAEERGIVRVSPNGGQPEVLVPAKNEVFEGPQILPGGQAILFTVTRIGSTNLAGWDKAKIVVQDLKSGVRKVLLEGGSDARYLSTGHLAYGFNGILFAVPFDLSRQTVTGSPVGLVEGVARTTSGATQFAFSESGSMFYLPGPVGVGSGSNQTLALVDRMGAVEPLKLPLGSYGFPRVSPDGKRAAYQLEDGKDISIWIYELSGAAAPRRLTLPGNGANRYPLWSSDGQRIAFQSDREGDLGLFWQRADGSGAAERLTKADKGTAHVPDSWSPDGQRFLYTADQEASSAVWSFDLRDKKSTLYTQVPGMHAGSAVFSPDGRWVAYHVWLGNGAHTFIQPFPPTAAKYQLPPDSSDHHPVWTPDGKQIFYIPGASRLASVTFTSQPSVSFGAPVQAPQSGFQTAIFSTVRNFDMMPDGKHFLGLAVPGATAAGGATQLQVVLNWFEEVKQRAPRP